MGDVARNLQQDTQWQLEGAISDIFALFQMSKDGKWRYSIPKRCLVKSPFHFYALDTAATARDV